MTGRIAFISHASQDAEVARKVCDFLEGKGISCWIAPRDVRPGHEFASEIMAALNKCQVLVLILSEDANESSYVKREVERMVSNAKPVFPIRIREVAPSQTLEFFVASSQWIDAWKPPIERYLEQLAMAIKSTCEAIHGIPDAGPESDSITPPPLSSVQPVQPAKAGSRFKVAFIALSLLILSAAAGLLLYENFSRHKSAVPGAEKAVVAEESVVPAGSTRTGARAFSRIPPAESSSSEPGTRSLNGVEAVIRQLGDKKGLARLSAVQNMMISHQLPARLTAQEMLDIADGAGNKAGLLAKLAKYSRGSLSYDDLILLLNGLRDLPRQIFITDVAGDKQMPESMTTDQALIIWSMCQYNPRILKVLMAYLPEHLDYADMIKIVTPLRGYNRLKAIRVMAEHDLVPAGLKQEQIDKIAASSSRREQAVNLLKR